MGPGVFQEAKMEGTRDWQKKSIKYKEETDNYLSVGMLGIPITTCGEEAIQCKAR